MEIIDEGLNGLANLQVLLEKSEKKFVQESEKFYMDETMGSRLQKTTM